MSVPTPDELLARAADEVRTLHDKAEALTGLTRALMTRIVASWSTCELVDRAGYDRCKDPVAAARFEDGFLDLVCTDHADSAEERGALVVRLA